MQLYSTLGVRHGLMLVGSTMSGKTTVLNVLAKAMSSVSVETKLKLEQFRRSEAVAVAKVCLFGPQCPTPSLTCVYFQAEAERRQREAEERLAALQRQAQAKRRQLVLQSTDTGAGGAVAINGLGSIVIRTFADDAALTTAPDELAATNPDDDAAGSAMDDESMPFGGWAVDVACAYRRTVQMSWRMKPLTLM